VLLRLREDRAIVHYGAAANARRAVVYRYGGIDEGAGTITMAGAQFGELAGAAAHGVLVHSAQARAL